jgi:hypothetical protein
MEAFHRGGGIREIHHWDWSDVHHQSRISKGIFHGKECIQLTGRCWTHPLYSVLLPRPSVGSLPLLTDSQTDMTAKLSENNRSSHHDIIQDNLLVYHLHQQQYQVWHSLAHKVLHLNTLRPRVRDVIVIQSCRSMVLWRGLEVCLFDIVFDWMNCVLPWYPPFPSFADGVLPPMLLSC